MRMGRRAHRGPRRAAIGIGRTDEVAVGVTQLEAFSTGFRFTLAVRLRRARPEFVHGGLLMSIGSYAHPGMEVFLEDRLLVGLEYSDGRRASSLDGPGWEGPGSEPDHSQVVLVQGSGGGDDRSADQTFWVAPLPPEGPVVFVLAWPSLGIAESRTAFDGAAIRAAAARSQVLWPAQPPGDVAEPPPPPPPPPPSRPSSGWFADPAG